MGTLVQDLRFAIRSLRRAPAFPLAAIATLALGIGATTAIFTTLNAVLLKPLPYPDPENLYSVRTTLTDGRVTTGLVAWTEMFPLNDPNRSIGKVAGSQPRDLTLLHDENNPLHVKVNVVTEGFFELFGLPMTLGGFVHDQFVPPAPPPQQAPGAGAPAAGAGAPAAGPAPQQPPPPLPAVVISHRMWRELFNSDRDVVGKPLRFAELRTIVAGVAHPDFDTPHAGDFWVANRLARNDQNHSMEGFMRIQPGADIERVKAEMGTVAAEVGRQYETARNRAYVVKPLVDQIVGDLGPILIIVMAATGLLLLLACVNVTNLLLARGAARAREMAVRVSLGAGRGRIVQQLLTESVVLATAGSLLGVLIAYLGVRGLMALGASRLPRLDGVSFDTSVLLFTLLVLVVSGLLVGFAPAIRLARTDVRSLMNESSRSTSGGRSTARWLSVMTVAEIALAIMLVAGAGWLVRGFANLRNTNLGFVAEKKLLFDVTFQNQRFPGPAVHAARNNLLEAIRGLQGVRDVGATSSFPLRGTQEGSLVLMFQGHPEDVEKRMVTRQRAAEPGFFTTMGTRIVQGREFGAQDVTGGQPVAIVNQQFVKLYLQGRDPIGVQFAANFPAPDPQNLLTIVGVAEDIRQKAVETEAEPAFYVPMTQAPVRRMAMVVSTTLDDPAPLMAAIRAQVRSVDPQIAVEFEQVTDIVSSTISRQQLGMTLMLIFGSVAVVLAAIGIYGVIAFSVSQRRDEMATRLALGASPKSVFWLVMKQGSILAVIGTVIGLVMAALSGRLVSNQIYAVNATDPVMLSVAIALVVGITVLVTVIPAWRASRLSPANALHPE